MCASFCDNDALDFRPTDGAGLSIPPVDPEMILKIPTAVNPVDTGTIMADAILQHIPDRHTQDFGLVRRDRIRVRQRVEPGHMQGLVGIDVTQTGEERLVKQERLELPVLGMQRGMQPGRGNWSESGSGPRLLNISAGSSSSQTRPNLRGSVKISVKSLVNFRMSRSCLAG